MFGECPMSPSLFGTLGWSIGICVCIVKSVMSNQEKHEISHGEMSLCCASPRDVREDTRVVSAEADNQGFHQDRITHSMQLLIEESRDCAYCWFSCCSSLVFKFGCHSTSMWHVHQYPSVNQARPGTWAIYRSFPGFSLLNIHCFDLLSIVL